MTLFLIDPLSGMSGDILLASLASIRRMKGFLRKEMKRALDASIRFRKKEIGHVRGWELNVVSGVRLNPSQMIRKLRKAVKKLGMGREEERRCFQILGTILEAEGSVHGEEGARFHQIGGLDTLVDILGTVLLLEDYKVLSLPIVVGRGVAPTTLEILKMKGAPFRFVDEERELCTPTGAALLANLAEFVHSTGSIVVKRVGYGVGSEKLGRTIFLKIVECETISEGDEYIVETNIDDMSGEQLAYVVERLFEEGAKDACLIPMIGKKGRPGVVLQVACERENRDRLEEVILEETTTLGVRSVRVNRRILERKEIGKRYGGGRIRVKVSGRGKMAKKKPEYEDVKRIAKKTGLPLRKIYDDLY